MSLTEASDTRWTGNAGSYNKLQGNNWIRSTTRRAFAPPLIADKGSRAKGVRVRGTGLQCLRKVFRVNAIRVSPAPRIYPSLPCCGAGKKPDISKLPQDGKSATRYLISAILCLIPLFLSLRLEVFASEISLELLLEKTGKRVQQLLERFSEVTCTEVVSQMKLGTNGKVYSQRKTTFDTLIILDTAENDISIEESRLEQGKPAKSKNAEKSLLVTTGFSVFLLVFHPYFRSSFEFELGDTAEIGGQNLQVVRFQHVRGKRSPSVLQLRGRDYPLEWQGDALVDLRTGSVARITARLKASMEDVGLKSLSSEVTYLPVTFIGAGETQWLPSMAMVEAESIQQHWKNTHQFSNYRLFSVTTTSKTEDPQ